MVVARQNDLRAPTVVGVVLLLAAAAVVAHERGAALAAIGVAATAAFGAPAGLGPLLVVVALAVSCRPGALDPRLAPWADVVDAVIALPALAGLAAVVASEPSVRGVAVGVGAAAVVIITWLRPPHDVAGRPASGVGLVLGVPLALAPQLWDWLGALPRPTTVSGRGAAAGFGVFAVVAVIQELQSRRRSPARRGQHVAQRSMRRAPR